MVGATIDRLVDVGWVVLACGVLVADGGGVAFDRTEGDGGPSAAPIIPMANTPWSRKPTATATARGAAKFVFMAGYVGAEVAVRNSCAATQPEQMSTEPIRPNHIPMRSTNRVKRRGLSEADCAWLGGVGPPRTTRGCLPSIVHGVDLRPCPRLSRRWAWSISKLESWRGLVQYRELRGHGPDGIQLISDRGCEPLNIRKS